MNPETHRKLADVVEAIEEHVDGVTIETSHIDQMPDPDAEVPGPEAFDLEEMIGMATGQLEPPEVPEIDVIHVAVTLDDEGPAQEHPDDIEPGEGTNIPVETQGENGEDGATEEPPEQTA